MKLNVNQYSPVCSVFYRSCRGRGAVCYVDLAVPLTENLKIRSVHIAPREFEIVAFYGYSSVHTNCHENGAFPKRKPKNLKSPCEIIYSQTK